MIKHTNFQFVNVNLFPRVVLALILGLNNYHLVVMCRADVADTVEVKLHYRFPFHLLVSHSGKSRSRLLKKSIFRENEISHALTEVVTDKRETTFGCFPDDMLFN